MSCQTWAVERVPVKTGNWPEVGRQISRRRQNVRDERLREKDRTDRKLEIFLT